MDCVGIDESAEAADAVADAAAVALAQASTGDAPLASTSVARSAPPSASPSALVNAVMQVKRRRLHLNLNWKEVRDELRTHEQWNGISDANIRRALTLANKQLGASAAAADVKTWRCSVNGWTMPQLMTLQALGDDDQRVHKAVIDAKARLQACQGDLPLVQPERLLSTLKTSSGSSRSVQLSICPTERVTALYKYINVLPRARRML